jgi:hypothetical protein
MLEKTYLCEFLQCEAPSAPLSEDTVHEEIKSNISEQLISRKYLAIYITKFCS